MKTVFRSRLTKGSAILVFALSLVGGFEGLRTVAYTDATGTPTICYGETLGVSLGDVKTTAECKEMFAERLPVFEKGMVRCIENPDAVPDKSYIALLSFTYNVGVGAFCKSTLVKKLNAGDLEGACNELPRWNKSKGRVLKGLVNRRAEEQRICLDGGRLNNPVTQVVNEPRYPLLLGIIVGIIFVIGVLLITRRKR